MYDSAKGQTTVTSQVSGFPSLQYYYIIISIITFLAHHYKAAGRKTKLDIQNYGCNGNLLCDHGVVERNRISSLHSHGKALEREFVSRVSSVIVVIRLPISCELNGHLMPCTSCLRGKRVEDVCYCYSFV